MMTVTTTPFLGQKPGTSGLRKKVKEVMQPHYLENFVQCVFDSLPHRELRGAELVIAGDGRYYNDQAALLIVRMAAAQGVGRIILAINHLMPTPCVSALVRERKTYGAFILTASHNPGGPNEDFGIKYNASNGGPAPESLTDAIFSKTKTISRYEIAADMPELDVSRAHSFTFGQVAIEVVDAAQFYATFLATIFDFDLLKRFVQRKDFSMVYDSMNGVAGPFARQVLVNKLGLPESSLMNAEPLPDFGGHHPDPNLTYAADLVARMGLSNAVDSSSQTVPDFGAASDGDADRNMILGARFFVTPSDSVAVIAANARFIPYFERHGGVKGVARSMPTSAALDRVAHQLGMICYEVPTGWKYFGNLMDAGKLSICGEESFGTGSDHCREKDGMWAILAWLSILAGRNAEAVGSTHLVSVREIVEDHWKRFGRNYYSRYDYEQVDSVAADKLMAHLMQQVHEFSKATEKPSWSGYTLKEADEFTYKDPVDHSISEHQGIRFQFVDGSRIVFRLSGTGSVGATVRVYVERYDRVTLNSQTAQAIAPLIQIALDLSQMKQFTGREEPTVIT